MYSYAGVWECVENSRRNALSLVIMVFRGKPYRTFQAGLTHTQNNAAYLFSDVAKKNSSSYTSKQLT